MTVLGLINNLFTERSTKTRTIPFSRIANRPCVGYIVITSDKIDQLSKLSQEWVESNLSKYFNDNHWIIHRCQRKYGKREGLIIAINHCLLQELSKIGCVLKKMYLDD